MDQIEWRRNGVGRLEELGPNMAPNILPINVRVRLKKRHAIDVKNGIRSKHTCNAGPRSATSWRGGGGGVAGPGYGTSASGFWHKIQKILRDRNQREDPYLFFGRLRRRGGGWMYSGGQKTSNFFNFYIRVCFVKKIGLQNGRFCPPL